MIYLPLEVSHENDIWKTTQVKVPKETTQTSGGQYQQSALWL